MHNVGRGETVVSYIRQNVPSRVPRPKALRPPSVAATVREYIDRRPVVRDALGMGIVNLSALSRHIMDETHISQEEAVLVACRRYQADPTARAYEKDIRKLLDKSRLEVRTRVAVWTLRPSWSLFGKLEKAVPKMQTQSSPVHVLHGSESITVIADEQMDGSLQSVLEEDDIIKRKTGLVEVNLRTPSSVEDVPGLLAFLASSLAGRGINFLEVVSCHKDNMFVIDEADLFPAFEVLNALVQG